MKLIFDIIKNGKDLPAKRKFHFNMTNGVIGRSNEADWQLVDRQNYISSRHIQIQYKDGLYFIKDLSTNGTYLKYPYKKLPKEVPIKINSTDIFVIGDYEIQARFATDDDYKKSDIISQSSSENPHHNNSHLREKTLSENKNQQLIPDDDFLLEDSSVMNNSFVIEEEKEEVFTSNVINMIKDEKEEQNFDDLYSNFEKSEPTVLKDDFSQESVSYQPLQEHINIPKFQSIPIDDVIDELDEKEKRDKKENIEEFVNIEYPIVEKESKENLSKQEIDHSISILEKKLGFELSSLNQDQRDNILTEVANIVLYSLDGLKNSLEIKNKIKKDLLITNENSSYEDANPIRMGQHALNLLSNKNKDGIKLSEAIKKSFSELDIHNIALHRSSKNLINIAVLKFSPKSLEHHFETNGQISALMPKKYQMWDSYINMFKKLNEDPDFGVNLIAKDFSNEYNNISYTIKLTSI